MISPFVVNIESKHPDYIYIKYAIYKASMEQRKNAELQNKVKFIWRIHFEIVLPCFFFDGFEIIGEKFK